MPPRPPRRAFYRTAFVSNPIHLLCISTRKRKESTNQAHRSFLRQNQNQIFSDLKLSVWAVNTLYFFINIQSIIQSIKTWQNHSVSTQKRLKRLKEYLFYYIWCSFILLFHIICHVQVNATVNKLSLQCILLVSGVLD